VADERRGLLFGIAAYGLWGLLPLYWPLLKPAGPFEILSHRFLWSLVVVIAILTLQRNWRWLGRYARQPRLFAMLTVAAVLIAVNWATYIYGVNSGNVVETSLGYFINPLVTVVLGVVVLRERLRPAQWVAVALAGVAVAVLTIDYGRLPWIAMVLAATFATYGLIKKKAGAGAVESLTVETAAVALPVLGFLTVLEINGRGTFGHVSVGHTLLLVGSGLVTAIPLLFFGAAATRVPLTTLGLLQYLAPILQFLIGVLLFHEPMPASRMAGFALVWVALTVFTVDSIANHRRHARLVRLAPEVVG
jgi:chloramphenicol-sensitive protein RarD